jgi:glycosyltransferase involved in cell wall biosynthesis
MLDTKNASKKDIDVLYLTHNGITDHIGQSQIAPYCIGLAERGYRLHIVSAEKPGRDDLIARYRSLFRDCGITWSFITYHNSPPVLSQLYDILRMRQLAFAVAKRERPKLVHCRSYLPIEIGQAIKRRTNAKLLIDFRHFWVEAGLEDSPYKFVYRAFKLREPRYFAAADHVVTLTKRAAHILQDWYPSPEKEAHYTVIPCCADFDHFDTRKVDRARIDTLRASLGFDRDDPVLLYLGSIGPDYLVEEMMQLFREMVALRSNARFLFVSNNGQERIEAVRRTMGIPETSVRFVTSSRDDVPAYLALSTLSVFFYRADLSRAGCSPTKLAELMAANIPVIGNTGVGDLDNILSPEHNGSVVVRDFEPATLRRALETVMSLPEERRARIRDANHTYSLKEGAARYASVYERLIGPPSSPATRHPITNEASSC